MEYRRTLPHLQPEGAPIFVTWRLFGSIPVARRRILISNPTPGHVFVARDRALHCAPGPKWLGDPPIAEFVALQIRRGATNRNFYDLHGWVIMPNHVHILMTPKIPLPTITRWLKGSTANHANRILGRMGKRFWQDESWDRSVRSGDEFNRIVRYIECNPVQAGLAKEPHLWPYSSASRA